MNLNYFGWKGGCNIEGREIERERGRKTEREKEREREVERDKHGGRGSREQYGERYRKREGNRKVSRDWNRESWEEADRQTEPFIIHLKFPFVWRSFRVLSFQEWKNREKSHWVLSFFNFQNIIWVEMLILTIKMINLKLV